MYPIYIHLGGPFTITIEGLFAVSTLAIGFFYQRYNSLKAGYSHDWFVSAYTFAILTGMVCARLFHFLFWETDAFLHNPLVIFSPRGGMAIMGATIGTGFGGWLYCRMTGVNFQHWCMGLMSPIAICLCLGRLACFFNGDAYGLPTSSFVGMTFSERSVDWMGEWWRLWHEYARHPQPLTVISQMFAPYHLNLVDIPLPHALDHLRAEGVRNLADLARYYPPQATGDYTSVLAAKGLSPFPVIYPPVHPAQLYEVAIMFVVFLIIFRAEKAQWAEQKLFFVFWFLYGWNRLIVEFFRYDRNIAFGNLTYAQLIAIGMIVFGAGGVLYLRKKWARTGVPAVVLK